MDVRKELFWGLGITVVVTILTIFYILNFQKQSQNFINKSTTTPSSIVSQGVTLTTTEIAKHNQASDCFIIIENKVYDVTSYLNLHPGGASRIIPYCGQDATQAFLTKDGQGSHSQTAFQDRTQLYLGDVNGAIQTTPNPTAIKNLPRRERREENED